MIFAQGKAGHGKLNSVHCESIASIALKYKNAMLAKMAQGTQRRYSVGVN